LGWTRRVPQLLCSHHLVIGKAGGATVHEAIAAQCPMLVHHLVPGQEEGNLQLLMMLGGGMLTETAHDVQLAMHGLLAQSAERWREMKHNLDAHHSDRGGENAAHVILECLSNHAEMLESDASDFFPNLSNRDCQSEKIR
jgi:processive 1,2-diacylglycerol beta-glucosyltransferase